MIFAGGYFSSFCGSAKFSLRKVCMRIKCWDVGPPAFLYVVLQHIGAAVLFKLFYKDSYHIRRAHCLPQSSKLLFTLPTSVSRLHNLRKVGRRSKVRTIKSWAGIWQVSGIPIDTRWLALYTHTLLLLGEYVDDKFCKLKLAWRENLTSENLL